MIPDFQTLMKPVLEAAKDGERDTRDVVEEICDKFKLNEEERNERIKSGAVLIHNRTYWARTYLKWAGLLRLTKRRHYEITENGKKVLNDDPKKITRKYLEDFEGFMDFKTRTRKSAKSETEVPTNLSENNITPEEAIKNACDEINAALASDLLDKLTASSPAFFERSIIDLLIAMNYGHDESAGQVIGKAGDGGVDGVINLDQLGVYQVYIQAKRYKQDNKIGPSAIREFSGALSLKNVSRGIFATTSSFTKEAKDTAEKLNGIVLIDGQQLTRLMIDHEIGCRTTAPYKIAEINEAYFDD